MSDISWLSSKVVSFVYLWFFWISIRFKAKDLSVVLGKIIPAPQIVLSLPPLKGVLISRKYRKGGTFLWLTSGSIPYHTDTDPNPPNGRGNRGQCCFHRI